MYHSIVVLPFNWMKLINGRHLKNSLKHLVVARMGQLKVLLMMEEFLHHWDVQNPLLKPRKTTSKYPRNKCSV